MLHMNEIFTEKSILSTQKKYVWNTVIKFIAQMLAFQVVVPTTKPKKQNYFL